jgi:hypothetical protein
LTFGTQPLIILPTMNNDYDNRHTTPIIAILIMWGASMLFVIPLLARMAKALEVIANHFS